MKRGSRIKRRIFDKKLIYLLFFDSDNKKSGFRAPTKCIQGQQQTTAMVDGTRGIAPTGVKLQEATEQDMDTKTYEPILATFTFARTSNNDENPTTTTLAPVPLPVATPTVTMLRDGVTTGNEEDITNYDDNTLKHW